MGKSAGDATLADTTPMQQPRGGEAAQGKSPLEGETSKSSSWAALFKENRKLENGIKLKEWKEDEREIGVDDLNNEEDSWGISIVGFILGRFPGRKAVDELRNGWGVKHHFYIHQSGWMVFKFECQEDRERVLSRGPYNTFGTPWLLKSMPPYFRFGDECLNFIPTWIQLPCLPLECWNETVLGKIVSYVGRPISTDQCTALRSRPGYARVLVEVDTNKSLVKEVVFRLPNGEEIKQQVVFEHPPILCKSCKRIGHSTDLCKKDTPQETGRPMNMGKGRGRSVSRRPTLGKEPMNDRGDTTSKDRPKEGNRGKAVMKEGSTSKKEDGTQGKGKGRSLSVRDVVVKGRVVSGGITISTSRVEEGVLQKEPVVEGGITICTSRAEEEVPEKITETKGGITISTSRVEAGKHEMQVEGTATEKGLTNDKGKVVVVLKEGEAPMKVTSEESTSNIEMRRLTLDKQKEIGLPVGGDAEKPKEDRKNLDAIGTRSQISNFVDMATDEELAELEEEREIASKKKEKNKGGGKNKNKGRSRHK